MLVAPYVVIAFLSCEPNFSVAGPGASQFITYCTTPYSLLYTTEGAGQ